jgi:hypothetical protein
MKTVLASDPADGDADAGGRRYIPLTLDSFRSSENFVWNPAESQLLADAIALQVSPVGLVTSDDSCAASDHSTPFLHGTRTGDLRAAIDSIEREGRLYADSGVDLVRVVDGQVLIAQAKLAV